MLNRDRSRHQFQCHLLQERTMPIYLRKWIDVEPDKFDSESYEIAEKMNTLLRHASLPREEDGAIEFSILTSMFASTFVFPALVNSIMAETQGERRRSQKEISSNPRSFIWESSFSISAGQCDATKRLPRVHLSRWELQRPAFHHQD